MYSEQVQVSDLIITFINQEVLDLVIYHFDNKIVLINFFYVLNDIYKG